MISIERVYNQLEKQSGFISAVELTMNIGGSVAEVRQRLNELGDRVTKNEHDEWRVVGEVVRKLELSPLSASEIKERDELENTVSKAFYVAGQALKVLRDKKLYRETHRTFESYTKERFDFSKSGAYYLISAFEVVENLKRPQFVDKNEGASILPTNESQCRPIAKLSPDQQRDIWNKAVEKASGKAPSARIVKQIVNELENKPKMKPKPNHVNKPDIINTPGLGIEYVAYLDEETNRLLIEYQEKIGAATKNGAIRRLLDAVNQQNNF